MNKLDHKKYRCKYELTHPYDWRHVWSVVTRWGGVHLHITENSTYGPSGGIEFHYNVPPEYRADDCPDHGVCPVTDQPCWHDGSSSMASEKYIPVWERNPHDHETIFSMLIQDAVRLKVVN